MRVAIRASNVSKSRSRAFQTAMSRWLPRRCGLCCASAPDRCGVGTYSTSITTFESRESTSGFWVPAWPRTSSETSRCAKRVGLMCTLVLKSLLGQALRPPAFQGEGQLAGASRWEGDGRHPFRGEEIYDEALGPPGCAAPFGLIWLGFV